MLSGDFFDGGPFALFPFFLFTLSLESLESLEFESSFPNGVAGATFSSLDFRELRLLLGDSLGLFNDLLSDSDSELLSGEKMLFFFNALESRVSGFGFDPVFTAGFGVLAPEDLSAVLPLASTIATVLGFAEQRLLGGKVFGLSNFGTSSSLEDEALDLVVVSGLSSSFFSGSLALVGDLGAGAVEVTGVSEVDDSESELLDPEPELVDVLSLLLESDEEPELLSVLLLLT